MKRGPKPQALKDRLSRLIVGHPDVANPGFECWIWNGPWPAQIQIGGKTRSAVRVLFELKHNEPLHDSNRADGVCPSPKCVNPEHYELRGHHLERWGMQFKPQALRLAEPVDPEQERQEMADFVQSLEERPTMEQFAEEHGYSLDEVRAIYALIK